MRVLTCRGVLLMWRWLQRWVAVARVHTMLQSETREDNTG